MNLFQKIFYPLTFIYLKLLALDRRFTKRKKLPAFTISIGNLSVGGTGKTPFTVYLTEILSDLLPNFRITILSRGYGGTKSSEGMIVLEITDPIECGDEPLLLKNRLSYYSDVWIGRNRYQSYIKYSKPEDRRIVLLDDGFQHHALERDLDIVLIDSSRLLENELLIPIGRLREPVSALERAQAVVFTKYDSKYEPGVKGVIDKIISVNKEITIFKSTIEYKGLRTISGGLLPLEKIKSSRIFGFCGLGNPEVFKQALLSFNPSVLKFHKYQDHHIYTEEEIEILLKKNPDFDYYICTEKDFIKIKHLHLKPATQSKLVFLEMELKVLEEKEFLNFIKKTCNPK